MTKKEKKEAYELLIFMIGKFEEFVILSKEEQLKAIEELKKEAKKYGN